MSTATAGSRLVLGLHRLADLPQQPQALHLDAAHLNGHSNGHSAPAAEHLASWARQVREAVEPSLVVDADGRIAAVSPGAAVLLGVDPAACTGVRLLDLVVMVDFTQTGVPLVDAEMSAPPLRALRSGRMSRGLVRLRLPRGTMPTYDVVGVPLAHGAGALAFFTEV